MEQFCLLTVEAAQVPENKDVPVAVTWHSTTSMGFVDFLPAITVKHQTNPQYQDFK